MQKHTTQQNPRFGGAIPLLRKFQEHPFWNERRKYSRAEAWIDLLFLARYGGETVDVIDRDELIPVGYSQILTSVITLSKKWRRSRTWVKSLLRVLRIKGSILVITSNNRRTILQIVNMGQVKSLLQNSGQQPVQHTAQQDIQQKDIRKTYNNKDNFNNEEITIIGNATNELISLFSGINPSYKLLYSNTTERKSLERLIGLYGEDKLRTLITSLPSIVQRPYAPRITTPYELELKIGKLLIFLKQHTVLNEKGGVTKV